MDATTPPTTGTVRMEMQQCPACKHGLDANTSWQGESGDQVVVRPGDLTVCMYCAALLEFDHRLRLRRLNPRTLASMSPTMQRKLEVLRSVVRSLLTVNA